MKINSQKLFSRDTQNFSVKTKNFGHVRYVNLDNAATTPCFFEVEKQLKKFLTTYGSVHRGAGEKSKISTTQYENAREIIKKFVNAPADSYVLFTNNTTGAVNTAAHFFSFLKGKVAVSEIEHSSSFLPWIKAEGIKKLGATPVSSLAKMAKVNTQIQKLGGKNVVVYSLDKNLQFNIQDIENVLKNNNIKVFVLTAASNVTGYCPDIKKIGRIVHKYGVYYLVDACQFVQHHKLDMREMGIDFLAASGHKFYAPFGGGFLIGPKKFLDKFLPYQIGGGNLPYITETGEFLRYENQLAHDPGTPNAVAAITMATAMKVLGKIGLPNVEKYEKNLARKIFAHLRSKKEVELYVDSSTLNTVIPFNIKDIPASVVADRVNAEYGVGVRAGSFCSYKFIRKLLNIKDERAIISAVKRGDKSKIPSLIRVSVGLCNCLADVKRFNKALDEIIKNYANHKSTI